MRRGETTNSGTKFSRWYQRHKDEPGFREFKNAQAQGYRDARTSEERKARYASQPPRSPERRKRDTEAMNRATARRRVLVAEIKNAPCSDCGNRFAAHVMDFDHRPGVEKTADVGRLMPSASIERVLEEVAKCDLVCSNCHRERTHLRRVAAMKPSNMRRAQVRRRRDQVSAMKDRPCADCGIRYSSWVMDFDHRDGAQKTACVSNLSGRRVRLLDEAAKCDVVCCNCHRERTHRRRLEQSAKR